MKALILLLAIAALSGCASRQADYLKLPDNGADTARIVDTDGNPNFGPR